MHDPNRLMKWLLVLGLVVLSLVILYPPSQKLKGGIDLVGGSSLLFEIDTAGLTAADQRGLATRVMNVLRDRVDPKGQLNLEWRPVGNTRLEIRMPRPPREVLERREAYNEALARLKALNHSRFDLESALNSSDTERSAALEKLGRGVLERKPLLDAVGEAFTKYQEAQASGDPTALEEVTKTYEDAVAEVLETSLLIGSAILPAVLVGFAASRSAKIRNSSTPAPRMRRFKSAGSSKSALFAAQASYRRTTSVSNLVPLPIATPES